MPDWSRHGSSGSCAAPPAATNEDAHRDVQIGQPQRAALPPGSGVATRLMQELVACAVERGAHRMVLEVAKGAAAARRLYERQGFVLDQDRRDTVVLRRDLPEQRTGYRAASHLKRVRTMRDHNAEFRDSDARKYAYDFDGIIRDYLLRTLSPWLHRDGAALELGCYKGGGHDRSDPAVLPACRGDRGGQRACRVCPRAVR